MNKPEIIASLKKELFFLQGIRPMHSATLNDALWFCKDAFPGGQFPLGAVHEFLAFNAEDMAATRGFISHILSQLLEQKNIGVWLSNKPDHFPAALSKFCLSPNQLLFVRHHNEKELLWVAEEFLKYDQLCALVAEFCSLDFTASRRFQLAVEKSNVTAFLLRTDATKITNNTCVSRWHIKSIPSVSYQQLPGVGFPAWHVEIQKMRNGKPASFDVQCINGSLQLLQQNSALIMHPQTKAVG